MAELKKYHPDRQESGLGRIKLAASFAGAYFNQYGAFAGLYKSHKSHQTFYKHLIPIKSYKH